jgi:hypothetical protein
VSFELFPTTYTSSALAQTPMRGITTTKTAWARRMTLIPRSAERRSNKPQIGNGLRSMPYKYLHMMEKRRLLTKPGYRSGGIKS